MDAFIVALARVQLDPQLEHGRWGEYRPNHNFDGPINVGLLMGNMSIPEKQKLEPGQPQEIRIEFIVPAEYVSRIQPGRQWIIQEGTKRVGRGEIIALDSCCFR